MKPFLLIFLPLLIAYTTAIGWCIDRWNAPTQYFAHCWLVPFVGAAVVWWRRSDWRKRPRATDLRGLLLLVPGLLLHLVGALLMIDSWSAASIVLTLPGAAWLALGSQRLRGLWPVLALVLFCVPLPLYVEGRLAFLLKEVAVTGGSFLANLFGAEVVRQGDRLQPVGIDGSLFVADACSGLRSLMAMATLAYCLAFFTGPASWLRRLVLLLVAAPMAIAANVCRIASLCLLARYVDVPFAEGTGHSIANAVEWLTLLALLMGFDGLLARRLVGAGAGAAGGGGDVATVPSIDRSALPRAAGTKLLWPAIACWVLAAPLIWLSTYRPFGDRTDRAAMLPEVIAGYQLEPRDDETEALFAAAVPRWRELLGTGDFAYRRYRDADRHLINLVALYHDTNWKSVHPPRICIEGSNMAIERDELAVAGWLGEGEDAVISRIVARGLGDSWRYVTLSVYGTKAWASGDYWQFVMHHLPRALMRRNESGFLLRVESPIYTGEAAEDAEARCRAFLLELLPMARGPLK
ncbi:MAG: exosortase/archaeosortase family protein [Planctomycetota bacterium]